MLVESAEIIGLATDRRLKNANVFRIPNWWRGCLINFDHFSRGGEEGDELGDLLLSQSEAFVKSRVVKDSFNFFQHGFRQN